MPTDPNQPYDMHEVIDKIVDDRNFFEIMPDYARNLIVGFARFEGVRSARFLLPALSYALS